MAMLFLLPFDSIDLPVGLPLEAKLDRPLLLLIVALWVLSLTILDGAQRVHFTPIHYAFVGFVLIAILSLVYNAETTVRLGEMELGVRKLALLISYLTLFVVVASGIRPERGARLHDLHVRPGRGHGLGGDLGVPRRIQRLLHLDRKDPSGLAAGGARQLRLDRAPFGDRSDDPPAGAGDDDGLHDAVCADLDVRKPRPASQDPLGGGRRDHARRRPRHPAQNEHRRPGRRGRRPRRLSTADAAPADPRRRSGCS